MKACLLVLAVALTAFAAPAPAPTASLSGQYLEARTSDVWTGACYANAEMNLTGKHVVMAWKIDQGAERGVKLDGLSVVAVVETTDTLGLEQTGPSKAVLLLDKKANAAQREALIAVARRLGGFFTKNIIAVETTPISLTLDNCKEGGCALLEAGIARVETRCLNAHHDSICGHEDNFYPPLADVSDLRSAMITDNTYTGPGLGASWTDTQRRGAYLGSFSSK